MATIYFKDQQIAIQAHPKETILEAARRAGIPLESPCGGRGTCGKCDAQVTRGLERIEGMVLPNGRVRTCCASVVGDVEVAFAPVAQGRNGLDITTQGTAIEGVRNPRITKVFDGTRTQVFCGQQTLTWEAGDTSDQIYGYAIDIGTTTLVGGLVDYSTGQELATASELNPQCVYAQDVIGRIHHCNQTPDGLETMYQLLLDQLNEMLTQLCQQTGVNPAHVYEGVYAGNTTMLHLATKTDPRCLGQYPYTPAFTGGQWIEAQEHGLHMAPCGQVYLPPLISGYVGGDITAGVLSCQLHQQSGNVLFIDIGTNGEMILSRDGALVATSTAAGPAFEGMNIAAGMRASAGAIDGVDIHPDGTLTYSTIQNAPPVGICGSGLFDVVAALISTGLITKSGKLAKPEGLDVPDCLKQRLQPYHGKPAFFLAGEVYLTQMDVRQIQLAKGAIAAGVETLLDALDVAPEAVTQVLIGGSFGYHLQEKSIRQLGLLPKGITAPFAFVGNTSKSGAIGFLLNQDNGKTMADVVAQVRCIELSEYPKFEKLFVKYMMLERVDV